LGGGLEDDGLLKLRLVKIRAAAINRSISERDKKRYETNGGGEGLSRLGKIKSDVLESRKGKSREYKCCAERTKKNQKASVLLM